MQGSFSQHNIIFEQSFHIIRLSWWCAHQSTLPTPEYGISEALQVKFKAPWQSHVEGNNYLLRLLHAVLHVSKASEEAFILYSYDEHPPATGRSK